MATEKLSRIYINGKRIGAMKELAEEKFGEHFLSIEVKMPERIFLIRLENSADVKQIEKFAEKHKLCKIVVFPRIEFCYFKGKKMPITGK